MALTEKQRTARQRSVGGSDIPAILGISPFKSAADVFLEKTHSMENQTTVAMEAGHMLEPAVIDWAIKRISPEFTWSSVNVRRTKTLESSSGIILPAHANLDFMFTAWVDGKIESRCAIEAKTTGMPQYWGKEGSDEVPDHVLVQCLWQALVANLDIVHVAVLFGDRGFTLKMYEIKTTEYEEQTREIIDRVAEFWNKNVMEGVAPTETAPKIDTIKKVIRVPKKSVEMPDIMVQSWLTAKEELSTARRKEAELKAKILSNLSDAEEGKAASGTVTYYKYDRREYTVPTTSYRQMKWCPRKDKP